MFTSEARYDFFGKITVFTAFSRERFIALITCPRHRRRRAPAFCRTKAGLSTVVPCEDAEQGNPDGVDAQLTGTTSRQQLLDDEGNTFLNGCFFGRTVHGRAMTDT